MKQVDKGTFFKAMGPLDVHPHIINGEYPYASEWRLRDGRIVGKSVGRLATPGAATTDYFLPRTERKG